MPSPQEEDESSTSAMETWVNEDNKSATKTTLAANQIQVWLPTKHSMPPNQLALQGSETTLHLPHEHSMFLHCIPATRKEIGANTLAKIRSCVCNSLFKSAKFYPILSHTDKLVGLCLYNCNFHQPGIDGDFKCTKYWDAVWSCKHGFYNSR